MGRIVVSQFVSLDGVVEDPDGSEATPAGGWVGRISDRPGVGKAKLDEARGADALLLGRRSHEFFAARWAPRTGELADRLNGLPKYVVSSTLTDTTWNGTTVLAGDAASAAEKLRGDVPGDIVVYASFQLVRTLLDHDLVDELRLMVFPVVLGTGARLFGPSRATRPLRLVANRTVDDSIAQLTYQPVRDAQR